MDLVRASNRRDRRLRQSDVAHLALADELSQRSNGLLDRRVSVDAMLIVEINGLHAKSLQRCFARLSDVLGLAVHTEERARLGIAHISEFGGENDSVALSLDGAP